MYVVNASSFRSDVQELTRAIEEACQEGGCEVDIKPLNAITAAQRERFWAMMGDLSKQVNWHGNKLTKEEWRVVLTAALVKQKVVPGIDGGFVVMGLSTKRMSKKFMSDLMELGSAFGNDHRVSWSDPDWQSMMKEYA